MQRSGGATVKGGRVNKQPMESIPFDYRYRLNYLKQMQSCLALCVCVRACVRA